MAPDSQIREADFYQIPSLIMGLFSRELQSAHKPLILDADWDSPYLGAGIGLGDGFLKLVILGGTARIKEMSQDAFAALICHEIGHVIGGAPYQSIKGADWASLEGQADFFAASTCLPRYFASLGAQSLEIRERTETAGYHLFLGLKQYSSETKNQALIRGKKPLPKVESTTQSYPSVQCRYETFRNPSKRSSCWYAP